VESTKTILKKKLAFNEMINHLENKGVQFDLVSKADAKQILQKSNYFFKIVSYRKNFDKNNKGKYIALDFGLLADLATIDMRLRYIALQMCLDIEHTIKTHIITDITNNDLENGYSIVSEFFTHEKTTIEKILNPLKDTTHYNYGIYNTYHHNPPIWVLFEIISFGFFVRFVEFYYLKRNKTKEYANLYKVLKYVKNIRNSAAHNTPLLMDIVRNKQLNIQVESFITKFVAQITEISKDLRRKRLTNRKIHDLTALFAVYDRYVQSKPMKISRYHDLKNLLNRSLRHQYYYKNHPSFVSVFNYFSKIIDFLISKV